MNGPPPSLNLMSFQLVCNNVTALPKAPTNIKSNGKQPSLAWGIKKAFRMDALCSQGSETQFFSGEMLDQARGVWEVLLSRPPRLASFINIHVPVAVPRLLAPNGLARRVEKPNTVLAATGEEAQCIMLDASSAEMGAASWVYGSCFVIFICIWTKMPVKLVRFKLYCTYTLYNQRVDVLNSLL